MISILKTIPTDQPFMYERQGYYHLSDNFPLADGSRLLPFISQPFILATGTNPHGILKTICGDYVADIGELPAVYTNDKTTIYWSLGQDTGLTIPQGKYYIECVGDFDPQNIGVIYDQWETRVLAAGGKIYAGQCMYNALLELAGGSTRVSLFKTEPFYVPSTTQKLKGSFNQSFDISFDK